jgi:hypothetical protein
MQNIKLRPSILHFLVTSVLLFRCFSNAWVTVSNDSMRSRSSTILSSTSERVGYLHGQSSCFLPLSQLDQDYYAPRILQVGLSIQFCKTFSNVSNSKYTNHLLKYHKKTLDCRCVPWINNTRCIGRKQRRSSRTRSMGV